MERTTQLSDEYIMKQVYTAVKKLNLSLEHCFRAADKDDSGFVTCNEFAGFLSQINAGLTDAQLARLVLILDEDCSGQISRQEFYNTLSAYDVASEHHHKSNRTYQQDMLLKFAGALSSRGISGEELFNMCDRDGSGAIEVEELKKFIEVLNMGFLAKEVHSLMSLLDLNKNGELSREEFLRTLTTGMQAHKVEMFSKQRSAPNISQKSSTETVRDIVQSMESTGHKVSEIFEFLSSDKLTLNNVSREMSRWFPHVSRNDILVLLNFVDKDANGMIDAEELKQFLMVYSNSDQLSIRDLFIRMAAIIDQSKLPTTDFLVEKGMEEDIPKGRFSAFIKSAFNIEEKYAGQLFNMLDLDNKGFVKQKDLVVVLESYRGNAPSSMGMSPRAKNRETVQAVFKAFKAKNLTPLIVFRLADKRSMGTITLEELKTAIKKLIPDFNSQLLSDLGDVFKQDIEREDYQNAFKEFEDIIQVLDKPETKGYLSRSAPNLKNSIQAAKPVQEKPKIFPNSFEVFIKKTGNLEEVISKYRLNLGHVYNLTRFSDMCYKFEVPSEEAQEMFGILDTNKKGMIFGLTLYYALEYLFFDLQDCLFSGNPCLSEISELSLNFTMDDLMEEIDWPIIPNLSMKTEKWLRMALPPKVFKYHKVLVLQISASDLKIPPEPILRCCIGNYGIDEPSGKLFSSLGLDSDLLITKDEFFQAMLEALRLKRDEALIVFNAVYKSEEESYYLFDFLTYFDSLISTYKEGTEAFHIPGLPYSFDSSIDPATKNFYQKIAEMREDLREPLNFQALSNEIQQKFAISKDDSLRLFRKLAMNELPIQLYHLLSVLFSYETETETYEEQLSRLCERIPDNTPSYFSDFPIHESLPYDMFHSLIMDKFNVKRGLSEYLLDKIHPAKKNKVFGYELFAHVDSIKLEKNFPFSHISRGTEEHKVLTKLSKMMDTSKKGTSDIFYEKRIDIKKEVNLMAFEQLVPEISEQEAELIFRAIEVFGKVRVYHFVAVIESYRKTMLLNRLTSSVRSPSSANFNFGRSSSLTTAERTQAVEKLRKYMKENSDPIQNIEQVFKRLDEKKTSTLSLSDFELALGRLGIDLSLKDIEWFKSYASNGRNEIQYMKFIDKVKNFQSFPVEPSPNSSMQMPTSKDYLSNLKAYRIRESDFYHGSTILNSEIAALKRCIQLVKEVSPFVDPDFGPEQENNGAFCFYWKGKPPSSNFPPPNELSWLSPREWVDGASFFDSTISANDVIQGSLGDCWLIGALSVLATRDDKLRGSLHPLESPGQIDKSNVNGLSKGVWPPLFHCFARHSLYVIRIFKDCKWRYVIIDDRVPVFVSEHRDPHYVFGHCREPQEMWVALIEKAYAKLHTCYESLNGGLIDDALVDLTGLVAEKIKVKSASSETLWPILRNYRENRTLMGCSIDGEGVESDVVVDGQVSGLLSRHAYGLMDVLEVKNQRSVKGRHRLLRLRNPWGNREWQGKWSDKDAKLHQNITAVMAEVNKLEQDEIFDPENSNDGTFLMCFKDWRTHYNNFFACVDFPDTWWGARFESEWTVNNSGGVPTSGTPEENVRWAKNPQFIIELLAPSEVFFSLTQPDARHVPGSVFPFSDSINTICFAIVPLEPTENKCGALYKDRNAKFSVLKAHREVHLRAKLDKGKHAVVPATMMPGKIGRFWLSMYFDVPRDKVVLGEHTLIEEEEESGDTSDEFVDSMKQLVAYLSSIR